jgi:hypothetical protein
MSQDEQEMLMGFFQRALEYGDRMMQIIEENLDVAEELPPGTDAEASDFLSQFQDLDPDFYAELKDTLMSKPDYRLSPEAYSNAREADLLARQDEILREYDELHRDAAFVEFLKTDFYYDAAVFEWRALMLVLERDPSSSTRH